jgi:hypothetical protein
VSNTASGKFQNLFQTVQVWNFHTKKWLLNGMVLEVHISEFEPKHPQLEPKPHTADPQGLRMARPDRTEPQTDPLLQPEPFIITSGSSTINVYEPSHGRTTGNVVAFRNVDGSPGGLSYTLFENSNGFSITVTGTDNYTFNLGSTPTVSGRFGGMTVTAGPVTLTP